MTMSILVGSIVCHNSDEDSPTYSTLCFKPEVKPWVLDLLTSQL